MRREGEINGKKLRTKGGQSQQKVKFQQERTIQEKTERERYGASNGNVYMLNVVS